MSARFHVQEFRVPLMKAVLRPPTEPLVAVSQFHLDMGVQYLAGGAASRLPVLLRAQVLPRRVAAIEGFEEFTFGNGQVTEGIVRRGIREFDDEEERAEGDETPPPRRRPAPALHQREALTLEAAGTARATITRLPPSSMPRDVLAELEFRDPNGEVQTVSTRVPLWPSAYQVGLRPESWAASRERLRADIAVVDVRGKPMAAVPVEVDLFERNFYSSRKRLVGGFYAYEHVEETRRLGPLCRGRTDAKGLLACEGKPPVDGRLVIQASVVDPAGHRAAANHVVWVARSNDWWFDVGDSDRIDLLPERRRYEPGDTARLQVRMPFREATALITVERDGVIEARVVPLSPAGPVIEVPIHGSYAPNVFVSALVVRGRVGSAADRAHRSGPPRQAGRRGDQGRLASLRPPGLGVTGPERLSHAREGAGAHRRAHPGWAAAAGGQRSGRRGRGRGLARAPAQSKLESPRRDDAPALPRRVNGHGPDAWSASVTSGSRLCPRAAAAGASRRASCSAPALLEEPRDARRQWGCRRRRALNDSITSFRIVAVASAERGSAPARHRSGPRT
jgi:hypothetical protein